MVSVMDAGGMESYIMNMYRCMDRTSCQFDFLVHHARRGAYEDEIEALGGKVYHTTLLDDGNLIQYKKALRSLFSEHPEYRIVHGHLGSTAYWYLGAAKRHGVPWRILHSHCPGRIHTLKGNIKHLLFRFSPRYANVRLACSEEAGRYQFRRQDYEVVPNGIDMRRFAFDEESRRKMRDELHLSDDFVIGHVGRFYYEKNHPYMLKLLQAILPKIPNAVLMLIGDGELMPQIKEMAQAMHLESHVRFMGVRRDVERCYSAMDAFVLPSVYEGFPMVGLEAQANGLHCFFTSRISNDMRLLSDTSLFPTDEGSIDIWAEALIDLYHNGGKRVEPSSALLAYDIHGVTAAMIERYDQLLEKTP